MPASRRDVLRAAALTAAGLSTRRFARGAEAADRRPHIILFLSDDHCPMRTVRTATHKYILNLHPERTFTTHITGCKPGSAHHLPFWNTWVAKAKTDPRAAAIVHSYMHRPKEELYDLTTDPYEQKNLAGDPASADVLDAMRKRLTQWRTQQNDPVAPE